MSTDEPPSSTLIATEPEATNMLSVSDKRNAKELNFHPTHTCSFSPKVPLNSLHLPNGSRMFLGNLKSAEISQSMIAQHFISYGNILEISIKNTYGLDRKSVV